MQERRDLAPDPDWWRHAVVYEVYIRSFADADGDGIGDIAGIRSRLPYLAGLGVDAIWITPWYRSPMLDGGYDVADYRDIDPLFGTLADAEALVREAHAHGIRVLVDIVPNHTSSAHPWFQAAIAARPGSPERARYWFRDGRGVAGEEPPNGWASIFGGPAWSRLAPDEHGPGQWYLHMFDSSQPDLDWDNPEVQAEFESILAFWLERGVDGFRIDVAHFLFKDRALPELTPEDQGDAGFGSTGVGESTADAHPYADREAIHEVYRSWRRVIDAHGPGHVTCGEIDLPAERIARYLRPDELHTAFNFDLTRRPWDAWPMRRSIDRTLASHSAVGAPATWVIGNHDLPRPTFRLGRPDRGEEVVGWAREAASDQVAGLRRARAAALLCLALPGVAYVNAGEELGLPEVLDLPPEARQDPTFHRTGGAQIGRDGDRVPIPWSGDAPPYGFGPDGSVPWLPQPATWAQLSVAAQEADPASTLSLYRAALRLRRELPGLAGDAFAWVDDADDILHVERGDGFRCLVNLAAAPVALPDGAVVLLRSDGLPPDDPAARTVPAETAVWYTA